MDVTVLRFNTFSPEDVNRRVLDTPQAYCLLLFGEVDLSEDQFMELTGRMSQDPGIAAIQPKILSDDGEFSEPGGAGGFVDSLGYWYTRGTEFRRILKDEGQFDSLSDRLAWVSPPVVLIKTEAFRKACGFDVRLNGEEAWVDLGLRFQLLGYSQHWYAGVVVVMGRNGDPVYATNTGSITGYHRSRIVVHNFESMVVPKTIMWILLDVLFAVGNILRFDFVRCRMFAISAWNTFIALPDWLRYRTELQQTSARRRENLYCRPFSIYWYHHGKLGKTASNALAIFLVIASVFSLTMRDRR